MSIRNTNSNVYLFDIDDQMGDGSMPQLGISCVDETIFISVSERTENANTVLYNMNHQLGFDIKTFISALNLAFNNSKYDILIDIVPKPELISKLPQDIIDVLKKIDRIEKVTMQDSDLYEEWFIFYFLL